MIALVYKAMSNGAHRLFSLEGNPYGQIILSVSPESRFHCRKHLVDQ